MGIGTRGPGHLQGPQPPLSLCSPEPCLGLTCIPSLDGWLGASSCLLGHGRSPEGTRPCWPVPHTLCPSPMCGGDSRPLAVSQQLQATLLPTELVGSCPSTHRQFASRSISPGEGGPLCAGSRPACSGKAQLQELFRPALILKRRCVSAEAPQNQSEGPSPTAGGSSPHGAHRCGSQSFASPPG